MTKGKCLVCGGQISVERKRDVLSRRPENKKEEPVLICSRACNLKKNLRAWRAKKQGAISS
jgi:hypothetical protein